MNAAVALGASARDLTAGCDSVWFDFTKGLGAVLAGSKEFIGRVWRWKQRLGGSMRQGGMNAAEFATKLRSQGVLVSVSDAYRGRACLYLDVAAAMVGEAVAVMRRAVA